MTRQNWWKLAVPLFVVVLVGAWSLRVSAHCEIPCGIYDDDARIKLLNEHVTTIEKSMKEIEKLSAESPLNQNQIVRWVMNKEDHANQFQEIVAQYFMTQRVKPLTPDDDAATKQKYVKQLTLLHEMLVYAMKSKQTVDTANTDKLRELVHDFSHVYSGT
ncbi:MAG: superoxide dismutase [Planctomycetaceae bacterium]|nr:superoxide dismutase [Planctomycetaceae bacterium]